MELCWILSGEESNQVLRYSVFECNAVTKLHILLFQIAKLCIIPVLCFLEIMFDKVRYSRDTKLSIMLVLVGVAVCTVSDVSVNSQGLIAAIVAVWSTALQQHVSIMNI